MAKIKWYVVWGIGSTVVFLCLLAVRLDVLQKKPMDNRGSQRVEIHRSPESWVNIYQDRKKIGVIHRTFNKLDNGRIQTTENVTMQINTMGVTQALNIETETELNADLTLSSFNFMLHSSLFRFSARGYVSKDKLILYAGLPSAEEKTVLPIINIPHIGGNIYEAAFRGGLKINQKRNFSIFDPSTLGMREIAVTRQADEIIPVMGGRVLTQKFCADFMGAKNCAWLAKDGEVLKESGMLGMTMEKVSVEKAREGIAENGAVDFTQVASIASNQKITDPPQLTAIEIKIKGVRDLPILLEGGRQKFSRDILTITRESAPDGVLQNVPAIFQKYLQSSPLVQANAPEMKPT